MSMSLTWYAINSPQEAYSQKSFWVQQSKQLEEIDNHGMEDMRKEKVSVYCDAIKLMWSIPSNYIGPHNALNILYDFL